MAVSANTFKKLANKFMNDTFSAFSKSLTMRTSDAVVFGSDQTYTNEVGTATPLSLDFSQFDSQLIEAGDFLLFTNASQWTTDPKLDNVDLIFDGVNLQILLVEKDADDAAYFITVRRK